VTSIDVCFLKGPWNVHLLAAFGRDENDNMDLLVCGAYDRGRMERCKDSFMGY